MSEFEYVFGEWLADTVTLEVYEGAGFNGDQYAAPATVGGVMVDSTRRLIRNAEGNEAVSETTLFVPEGAPAFSLDDRVTVRGRASTVMQVTDPSVYGLFSFQVVNLA